MSSEVRGIREGHVPEITSVERVNSISSERISDKASEILISMRKDAPGDINPSGAAAVEKFLLGLAQRYYEV